MLEELKKAPKKTIGTKQTLKAIEKNQVKVVFIAEDAEEHVVSGLREICKQKGIEVIPVATMKELGEACGIQVGAASAAILNL